MANEAPIRGSEKPTRATNRAKALAEKEVRVVDTNAAPDATHPFRDPGERVLTNGIKVKTH